MLRTAPSIRAAQIVELSDQRAARSFMIPQSSQLLVVQQDAPAAIANGASSHLESRATLCVL